jgi:hypothetical protein
MAISPQDITRMQSAIGSQQAGNDVVGTTMFKGGFRVSGANVVAGSTVGPFTCLPDSGGTPGTYRAYLNAAPGAILAIENVAAGGFTPRAPSASETTIVQVCGFNIDAANNQWYITLQEATFAGALQGSLPSSYVIGIQAAVTFAPSANPL